MAITLGSEVALALHSDTKLSYADVEEALLDVGFDNYTIARNIDYDGGTDVQIFVRTMDPAGLPATDTLTKLGTAVGSLTDSDATADDEA